MDTEFVDVKPKTRLVTLHLYQVTRRQYSEVIEVPDNISPGEIKSIAVERFAALGKDQFKPDRTYRKREVFTSDEGLVRGIAQPSLTALRNTDGEMVLTPSAAVAVRPAPGAQASSRIQEDYKRL